MDRVKKVEKVQNSSWARSTVLGKGSFGTVSLAVNKSNGAVFAVKSVDVNSCLPYRTEALENEITILRLLSSPYVVGYLGDDSTVETPAPGMMMTLFRNLHMEYLPGGTVGDVARGGARYMDEKMIKNYTFCIVSGLRYLHSEGIVHCDIKAENVLVGPIPGTAKLADFGSAKDFRRKNDTTKIMPRGSPLWMSPEVVRGEYQGPESDVWSLGCTVIEMVTGKPAWEDRGAAETLCRIGYSDELPRLPTRLSELGRDFVGKCLRRDVKERWSCDQLLQHPFISMCSPSNSATYSSPRCVLDWFNLDSDDEEDEEEKPSSSGSIICDSQAKGRIGKLACVRGAVWESDGWMEVRGCSSLSVPDSGCCSSEGGGTSWECLELIGIEGEVSGVELENEDSNGIGESSGRTSGECLVDSNCNAVVEVRNNDSHHDGVVTNAHDSGPVDSRAGDSHWTSGSQCLVLFYLFLTFYYIFDDTICRQFPDSITYKRNFCYIFICASVCAAQRLNFDNFHKSFRIFPPILNGQKANSQLQNKGKNEMILAVRMTGF